MIDVYMEAVRVERGRRSARYIAKLVLKNSNFNSWSECISIGNQDMPKKAGKLYANDG